jgi:CheY-like chemotaxis protein/anti-sigma regulatory factor (Ser/Thr protein kinase)
MNAVTIMQRRAIEDPELRWCRDVIERQTRQFARLVDDLLDVSRITHGKITLRSETVNLADIVLDAMETTRPLVEARRQVLNSTRPARPVWVRGDPARLTQVLANLLNNASKFQGDGGQIDISISRQGDQAEIRVRDQGVGIAPEALAGVFQLFVQGERNLNAHYGGLGVGLFLVKNLVALHQGTVEILSEGPGRGTECVVRLPALVEPVEQRENGGDAAHGPPVRPRRVLVVDDNRDAAESLAMLLQLGGHIPFVAHDGEEALRLARLHRPEIFLLDLGLPGMDGYEICRNLRTGGFTAARIIAMSGFGQERDRDRSQAAGFDSHTVKPVEPAILEKLLASA